MIIETFRDKEIKLMKYYYDKYIIYLREERSFSEYTVQNHKESLNFFFRFCKSRGLKDVFDLTREQLEKFEEYLYRYKKAGGEGLSFLTQCQRISNIKSFFSWLIKRNYALINTASELELPRKGKQMPRHVLTIKEAEKILQKPDVSLNTGIRDKAILETFYSSGIRRCELINLKLNDIDFKHGTLMIRHGKGAKDRIVPVGQRALNSIENYIKNVRVSFQKEISKDILFLSKEGLPLRAHYLGGLVKDYIKASGVNKSGSCHLFRHTMATLMLENGANVKHVQQILGHAKLETTQIYTHVSLRKLKEVYLNTHPSAKLNGASFRKSVSLAVKINKKPVNKTKNKRSLLNELLTADDIKNIINQIDINHYIGIRDRTILEIFLSTGITRKEIIDLMIYQVNRSEGTITINESKIKLDESAARWLNIYLNKSRKYFSKSKSGYLFLSQKASKLNIDNFGRIFNRYLLKAKINKVFTCKSFRESRDKNNLKDLTLRFMHTAKKIKLKKDTISFYLDKHLQYLKIKNYAKNTITERKRCVNKFINWCKIKNLEKPVDINPEIMREYQRYIYNLCNERTREPLSINRRHSLLDHVILFFSWSARRNYVLYNPAADIELPKIPKTLPKHILTVEEIEKIFSTPDINTVPGIRDRTILELLYSTGIRRAELSNIKIKDINIKKQTILITNRHLPLSKRALEWLLIYLNKSRPSLLKDINTDHLFLTAWGSKLCGVSITNIVREYIKKAELGKEGSSLLFRHAMATQMLENGADLRYIQQMLGHKSIETTKIYTNVSIARLKEIHTKTHPSGLS